MKVVHVISGLENGGAEAVLYRLVTHEPSIAAHEHVVVSLRDAGTYGPLLRQANVELHEIGLRFAISDFWRLAGLVGLLRRLRPDVVQTWMYHADLLGGVAARLAGIDSLAWNIRHSTLDPRHDRRSTLLIARLCARLSAIVPRKIVCCAQRACDVHVAEGYDGNRMVMIPNGYDLTRFRPAAVSRNEVRVALGIDDATPLLGMVARHNAQKDHKSFFAALGRLQQQGIGFHAVLVGAGITQDNASLAAQLSGLEDRVTLLGPRSDIPALMNAMDVYVLSSSHGEAFPNVLSEAMACGTPCVTTDVGDAAFIVGDTGWVVPPGSTAALSDAMMSALDMRGQPELWRQRQQAARARVVENFDINKMIAAYAALWQGMIDAGSIPSGQR